MSPRIRAACFLLAFAPFAVLGVGCSSEPEKPPVAVNSDVPPMPETEFDYAADVTKAEIVVAGGCFWCTEAVFEEVNGVTDVVSGYAGGSKAAANYTDVCSGTTAHAEAIRITFNPQEISLGKILQIFFTMHDPTQLDAQYPDFGHQYRSAVFHKNAQEKAFAEAYIARLNASGFFDKTIATTVEPLDEFYPAEDYHQDYVKHHPLDPYVMQWSLPKLEKLKKLFKEETSQ